MKLGLVGCRGRMGSAIVDVVSKDNRVSVVAGIVSDGGEFSVPGLDSDFKCCSGLEELFKSSDLVIEFANDSCARDCVEVAKATGVALVSGSTLIKGTLELMAEAAKIVPIFWASNMSYGVAVTNKLVEKAAAALKGYDIDVFEMHHRHKKDPVSGTAMTLAESAARGSGGSVDMEFKRGAKSGDKVNFAVCRGGGVFGDHSVVFASEDQMVTISHRALDRHVFARGAVDASLWLHEEVKNKKGKPLRLFSMVDMCPGI